jgi:DNA-directed RNA polymerase II subunit RPB1
MLTKNNCELMNKHPSKIIGIQFSTLSPEEIRNTSVAEIKTRDTYENNKPVLGGLFDPRMGVLEPGLLCLTDGLDYKNTPGYHGHIELAKPVFYYQFSNTVLKILNCICYKCSRLLICKKKHRELMKLSNENRWSSVYAIASSKKRCGEDTDVGCGCLQPTKISKEGISKIIAEWKKEELMIKLTAEMVLHMFKRIPDEDILFMGFHPVWSRPEWMICQVLLVPAPAIRPSVKSDAQQRSEDDLTHILIKILKTNKIIQDKIKLNSSPDIIDNLTILLQYYVSVLINNKIPNVASLSQRSGRPLKSINDRLNGKSGRMRGNLMAKRVDYSARSVITAEPNISILELGIPLRIAMNLTKPLYVNDRNKSFLYSLITNGPDKYPGAKIWQKSNGESITLRYIDKESIHLENGDIVHRHLMDGDAVLFNRQPTLHRMSMMGHLAKILFKGDTFRLNLANTKPYNADYDGDEMNLHVPQDPEAESELKNLALVSYQIISPANNSSIIGIFQDAMLGSYLFSREGIEFTKEEACHLMMFYKEMDISKWKNKKVITNYDLLTQILPPLSLKYKTKGFQDNEDFNKTKTGVLEIVNGVYIRGQMTKDVLSAGSKGLIQRIYNDFGHQQSTQFIDNLQNVITEYMNNAGFSVGISDLISDKETNDEIVEIISKKKIQVKNLIDETLLGIFENFTGKSIQEEFETQVNNILNQATSESGKIALKRLSKQNRFITMVKAGSKGSDLNISFMISCLGQQNVDGKRIAYGFENRTLPHFQKFDDSPQARGFVESSYISGLNPQEFFFHAMGGRTGLIDTAVKTSITGYIQRKLIKALEDLMVQYDMTVRNNKNTIVQFHYGDDNIDPVKIEMQHLPFIQMSIQDIYTHFHFVDTKETQKLLSQLFVPSIFTKFISEKDKTNEYCLKYSQFIIEMQHSIVKHIFKYKNESMVHCPVSFSYLIDNIKGQCELTSQSIIDITFVDAFEMIESTFQYLESLHYTKPTLLFKTLYFYFLSPKELLIMKRFHKNALTILLNKIVLSYKKSIITPGEMVGIIAGQSIGEVSTQMTLNTFHFAGVSSKSNVTRGVPRIEEILSLSNEPKNPSLTVYFADEYQYEKEKINAFTGQIECVTFNHIVSVSDIIFDPDIQNTNVYQDKDMLDRYHEFEKMISYCSDEIMDLDSNKSKWILRLTMNREMMFEKNITMNDIFFVLNEYYKDKISCVYSDYNSDSLIFRIRMNKVIKKTSKKKEKVKQSIDQSDQIYLLNQFQTQLLENVILRGIKGISKVNIRKIKENVQYDNGQYHQKDIWVVDTIGKNLSKVLSLPFINKHKTFSNDIVEMYNVLGIEAARQAIYNEFVEVIEFDGTYINYHHFCILIDRMTYNYKLTSIHRHGINSDNIGPIAKASFEETPKMFVNAGIHGELDNLKGISSNIMCGQEGLYGTSCFQVFLNMQEFLKLKETKSNIFIPSNEKKEIHTFFQQFDPTNSQCSLPNIQIQNHIVSIHPIEPSQDYQYDIPF